MENRRRIPLAPVAAILAIVVAVAVYLVLTGQSKGVDMPSTDAAPEQVVAAYMEALDAGDCSTAGSLVTEDKRESAASWCRKVAHMSDVRVGQHFVEEPQWSGHSAADEVVGVPVTFDLDWRIFHDDISMEEGHTTWSYFLVRSSPSEAWQIFGEGNG